MKPTTSTISSKLYRCTDCGVEEHHSTNHYGDIYCKCRKCGWKYPLRLGGHFKCLTPCPPHLDIPEPWAEIKLGDIATIKY